MFKQISHLFVSLLLISTIVSEKCKNEYRPPRRSLWGHFGRYRQNMTGAPVNFDKDVLLQDMMKAMLNYWYDPLPDKTFVFMSMMAEPFVFALVTDLTEDGEEEFVVWGPMYSILVEAAKHLNYSTAGYKVDGRSFMNALVRFPHDLTTAPVFAHYKILLTAMSGVNAVYDLMAVMGRPITTLSRAIGVEMMDCIVFRKESNPSKMFQFLSFIEPKTRWLFALSALATAAVLASFKAKRFLYFLARVIESLFDIARRFDSRFYSMFVLWLTVFWFFQQLFGGDMFSIMSTPPQPKIIDSWADLAEQPQLKIVLIDAFGSAEDNGVKDDITRESLTFWTSREDYLPRASPFYRDFTSRANVISITQLQKDRVSLTMPDGNAVDMTRFDDDHVMMTNCVFLRFRHSIRSCDSEKRLHVSTSGGEMLPYFIYYNVYAEQLKRDTVDEISVRLSESGVYQKWLTTNTYDLKEDSLKPPLFEASEGRLNNFVGPLWIFATMLTFAAAVFFAEILFQKVGILLDARLRSRVLRKRSRALLKRRQQTYPTERRRDFFLQLE